MKQFMSWAVVIVAIGFVLAGCGSYKQGPKGVITSQDTQTVPITHPGHCYGTKPMHCSAGYTQIVTTYYLTTSKRFEVSEHDYNRCVLKSAYPKCTKKK